VEQKRECDDRGAQHDDRKDKADGMTDEDERPAAPRGEYLVDKAGDGFGRFRSEQLLIEGLRSQKPGDEDRQKHDADRRYGGQARRMPDFEGMSPGSVEALFASPAYLVEAERGERSDQRET